MINILSLGLDRSIEDPNSKTSKRIEGYKDLVDKYYVLAPKGKFKILSLFNLFFEARKIITKENINLVTVQDPYFIGLISYILVRIFNIRLEIQIHGWEKFSGLRKLIAEFIIPRANSVRVVSQRLKTQLIKDFRVEEGKITVVPVYVETQQKILPVRDYSKKDNLIFLTVGRLVPVKNISLQIEAMVEIVKKYPETKLWIIGDGPEMGNLKSKIDNLGLINSVKLLGWQSNPESFYKQVDAFVLTSNAEGWPLVIIEAGTFELPIIMTNVGSAEDLILDRKNGLIVPINDKDSLIKAINEIIENSDLRRKIGKEVYKSINNLPTKEEILKLYRRSWQKALL